MQKQYRVTHSEAEWRKVLTPEQYDVMRGHGTELPGSCALNHEKRAAHSIAPAATSRCFAPSKFESGTGWPSFTIRFPARSARRRSSYGMARTEVIAAVAAPISAMSSRMARRRRACAIASMASR